MDFALGRGRLDRACQTTQSGGEGQESIPAKALGVRSGVAIGSPAHDPSPPHGLGSERGPNPVRRPKVSRHPLQEHRHLFLTHPDVQMLVHGGAAAHGWWPPWILSDECAG